MESGVESHQVENGASVHTPQPEQPVQVMPKAPNLERKVSKRKEAQEEKTLMVELFKEIIGKVNETYYKATAAQHQKPAPRSRAPKPRRQKSKEPTESKPREPKLVKVSVEETKMRDERKEELWSNYSVLMGYSVLTENSGVLQ